jgi:hypothetical protein
MCDFDNVEIIAAYPLSQALEDGVLVKLCDTRFGIEIKSLVATSHLLNEVGKDKVMKAWDEYVKWREEIMPRLNEEDQMFVTHVDGKKIWVIEDGAAFTAMFPEDY